MRKKLSIIAVSLAMLMLMTACGTNANSTNNSTNSTTAETTSETKISENGNPFFDVKQRGIEFEIAQEYLDKGAVVQWYDENEKGYKNVSIDYFSPECMEYVGKLTNEESANGAANEYIQKIRDTSRCLMEVVIVENDEYEKAMANGGKAEDFTDFAPAEYYGTNDGYAYLISIPDLDDGALTAEAAADYHACKEYMETVKENLKFIPLELEGVFDTMPQFKTTDLMGNEVTREVFGQAEFTVVNIWGTFCGACIDEMPELAQLAEKYDGNVQFVGIVEDVNGFDDDDNLELAKLIVEKAGVTYTNLVVNDDLKDFTGRVVGFPTTLFVDQSGNIIGDPIVGANITGIEQRIENMLAGNN